MTLRVLSGQSKVFCFSLKTSSYDSQKAVDELEDGVCDVKL